MYKQKHMKTKKIFMITANGYWLGFGGNLSDFADAKVFQGNPQSIIEKLNKQGISDVEVYDLTFNEEQLVRETKLNKLLN